MLWIWKRNWSQISQRTKYIKRRNPVLCMLPMSRVYIYGCERRADEHGDAPTSSVILSVWRVIARLTRLQICPCGSSWINYPTALLTVYWNINVDYFSINFVKFRIFCSVAKLQFFYSCNAVSTPFCAEQLESNQIKWIDEQVPENIASLWPLSNNNRHWLLAYLPCELLQCHQCCSWAQV